MDEGILEHVMIRVEDIDRALEWYQTHFDYVEYNRGGGGDYTIVKLGPEEKHEMGALLELTYNHDDRSYSMGDGWGHIAVRVDDLEGAYAQLMENGVDDYRDPESCGGRYAFVKDPDGHEIELVEREYGAQWSLDHTMMRVSDADLALGWFTRKFGYEEFSRWEADTFANFHMAIPDADPEAMTLELTYNYDRDEYDLGDAWGHLAIACHNLDDFWEILMLRGAEDYRDPASCDHRFAFTRDFDGHEFELIERTPS